ncbi:MAG: hypothetical protein V2J07_04925 [Anaerolineae bacterium]|jgi:uncharacterized membrane protein YGL010W|nr:hypothetical protein [Anaerolineae bacterium]
MKLLEKFKASGILVKAVSIIIIVLAVTILLVRPLLTVDAGEQLSQNAAKSGLAFMARQDATGGILLLGLVLVLVIVAGTLRVINQDRIHRPHLQKRKGKASKEITEEADE